MKLHKERLKWDWKHFHRNKMRLIVSYQDCYRTIAHAGRLESPSVLMRKQVMKKCDTRKNRESVAENDVFYNVERTQYSINIQKEQ